MTTASTQKMQMETPMPRGPGGRLSWSMKAWRATWEIRQRILG